MKILGRIICAVKRKHLRGVPVPEPEFVTVIGTAPRMRKFRCPRCHRETRYKVRQPLPATNGTNGEEA